MIALIKHRGFALPMAIFLLVVIFGLGAAYFTVSRQQVFSMSRHAAMERSWHLCRSGLLVGQALVDQTMQFLNNPDPATRPKRLNAPLEIAPLVQAMLDTNDSLNPAGFTVTITHPALTELQNSILGSSLSVVLKMNAPMPLYSGSDRAVPVDTQESSGTMEIEASASVDGAASQLVALREMRYVNITPTPIGRFTVLIREFLEHSISEGPDSLPVVLQNGENTACFASRPPEQVQTMIQRQGWVALGNAAEMTLGANSGNNNASHRSPCLQDDMYFYEIPSGDDFASQSHLMYYAREDALFEELRLPSEQEPLARLGSDQLKTSALLLHGSDARFSPTLVIGPVLRASALLQGLYNTDNDKFSPFPWLDSGTFASSTWPGGWSAATRQAIHDNFGGEFSRYQSRASRLYLNDANYFLHRLLKDSEALVFSESNTALATMNLEIPTIKAAGVMANFTGRVHATTYELDDDEGSTVFKGGDFLRLEELPWLTDKAGYRFRSGEDFISMQAQGGNLRLAGVVRIRGDLKITQPLRIPSGQGGIIVVEEGIQILAPILAEDSEPLTLISAGKDIEVFHEGDIQAALIALRGAVQLPAQFDLLGLVAAKHLRFSPPSSARMRQIRYNRRLDPANSQNRKSNIRLMTQGGWQWAQQ